MVSRSFVCASLVLLLTGAADPNVAGQSPFQRALAEAVTLYRSFEYERALTSLARARQLATSSEDQVSVGLYEGIVLANLGKRTEAVSAFQAALRLRPDAKLPVTVAPKIETDFELIRAEVRRTTPLSPAPLPDPDRPSRSNVKLTPNDTHSVQVVDGSAPPPKAPSRVAPIVLASACIVAGLAGGYFGLASQGSVQQARDASFQDDRARSLKTAGSQATTANALFAAAGVAGLGAVLTFTLAPSEAPHR